MAKWVKWQVDEFRRLIEVVEREGFEPPRWALEELSRELRTQGERWTSRAREVSFRSPASIASQIYKLRLLARRDPRAERETSPAMREAWRQSGEGLEDPGVGQETSSRARRTDGEYAVDRSLLIEWADELRRLLADLVEGAEELLEEERAGEFRAAWVAIRKAESFERLAERLRDPAVEPALVANHLVGPSLELKTNGFWRTVKRITRPFTWTTVRPVLKWANVILGSLTNVIPLVEPIKEFKESWEATAEEAHKPVDA